MMRSEPGAASYDGCSGILHECIRISFAHVVACNVHAGGIDVGRDRCSLVVGPTSCLHAIIEEDDELLVARLAGCSAITRGELQRRLLEAARDARLARRRRQRVDRGQQVGCICQ